MRQISIRVGHFNYGALLLLVWGTLACHSDDEAGLDSRGPAAGPSAPHSRVMQVVPPVDLKTPPADATKTASGLIYKKLATNAAGAQATDRGTALVHYTGWRQRTGDTFFTTKGREQPIALDLNRGPHFNDDLGKHYDYQSSYVTYF